MRDYTKAPEKYLKPWQMGRVERIVNGEASDERIYKFFKQADRHERQYYDKLSHIKAAETRRSNRKRKKTNKIAAITIISIIIATVCIAVFVGLFGEYVSAYFEDGPYFPVDVEYHVDGDRTIIVESSYKYVQEGAYYYTIYTPVKKSQGRGKLVKKVQGRYAYQPYYND